MIIQVTVFFPESYGTMRLIIIVNNYRIVIRKCQNKRTIKKRWSKESLHQQMMLLAHYETSTILSACQRCKNNAGPSNKLSCSSVKTCLSTLRLLRGQDFNFRSMYRQRTGRFLMKINWPKNKICLAIFKRPIIWTYKIKVSKLTERTE